MATVLPRTLPAIRLSVAAIQVALFMTLVTIAAPVFAQAPATPINLRVEPGDGALVFTWDDPSDPSITGYEYRARITTEDPVDWRPDWTLISDSDATTTNVRSCNIGNGVNLTFELRAVQGSIKGHTAQVSGTPRAELPRPPSCPASPPPPPPPPPRGGTSGGGGSSRDDHGNTSARATSISLGETAPWSSSTAGQINTTRDVDYFQLILPHAGVLLVETIGSTDTVGTVWQDDEELAMADSGGLRRNFRLSVRVEAGPVVIAVEGNGTRTGSYTLKTTLVAGYLENPGPGSFQSGIGVLSGWVCDAEEVVLEIESSPQVAAYGTERLDTEATCGDTNNGFGLLYNWNHLEDGEHTVVARVNGVELGRTTVDGVELGRATVTVTTLGTEFLEDVAGECIVENFPMDGETVRLVWQQTNQNFMITGGSAPGGENAVRAGELEGYLENPESNSFQSGLGVISGWVCEAETVEIEIETEGGETERYVAGYGTERLDTEEDCSDTNNGFGLLFNWNLLDDGVHTVVAWVDDGELGRATVLVTTLGEEFLEGVTGECVLENFPMDGETVRLVWQQRLQNFMVAPPGQ